MRLRVVPLELSQANELVARLHRHHKPVVGHRFSIGAADEKGELHGAAIVGRPVARMVNPREVLEVTRLVTDGTRNACSLLYSAAARAGRELGYRRIQTYILDTEPGTSLRAAGWFPDGESPGGAWRREADRSDGGLFPELAKYRRNDDHPLCAKQRWARDLRS